MIASSQPPQLRAPAGSVLARLYKEPQTFDFFQAVRLLERSNQAEPHEERSPCVRFRAHNSSAFPASEIYDLEASPDDPQATEMTVTFLGLTGPSGVLPHHYTEMMLRLHRELRGNHKFALRDWFDLFNDRLTRLFYRVWEKNRFWVPYSRREFEKKSPDAFTQGLLSLGGFGLPTLRDRLQRPSDNAGVSDLALLRYSGLLAQQRRSAENLRRMLVDYFKIPIEVKPLQGQWLSLDQSQQTKIGRYRHNQQLGKTAVLGRRVWELQHKFRLQLGPLTLDQFNEFLPAPPTMDVASHRGKEALCGQGQWSLGQLTRVFVGPSLDFDIQLVLKKEEVPKTQLSGDPAKASRLGWNAWIGTKPADEDQENASFTVDN
ncbi:type VI secretion system baseplate subunit TssG [Blastopirellula sp. J2-11]|uniref:type VI secretion system baseplate subunit TssG n=1 Tax=Blastopirellula sp. J2-11 TaxID=2943192 RepID=UPI0021C7BA8F|nr:type VI secretion system baseplate subunit TssG [Blastopirellula sp. J2-11]UUO06275.1 type VI secretion system baseplate subunit TssG [Blastopirellula sp. J2-11]